jgi:hypothetical protein
MQKKYNQVSDVGLATAKFSHETSYNSETWYLFILGRNIKYSVTFRCRGEREKEANRLKECLRELRDRPDIITIKGVSYDGRTYEKNSVSVTRIEFTGGLEAKIERQLVSF